MAKIQFGSIVQDARGKVAGNVFSKNRSGSYIKRKVSPTNPRTTSQTVVRVNFTGLSKAWGGVLTSSQQTEWNNFAVLWPRTDIFGNAVKISGQNMFISLGQRAIQIGLPYLTDPPADLSVIPISVDPLSFTVSVVPALTFDQVSASADASQRYYIFATAPLPPGRQPKQSDFRFIGSRAGALTPFPASVDVTTDWTDVFGATIAAGSKVGIAIGTINNVTFGVDTAVQAVGIAS